VKHCKDVRQRVYSQRTALAMARDRKLVVEGEWYEWWMIDWYEFEFAKLVFLKYFLHVVQQIVSLLSVTPVI
jgi:hypothetical protein